LQAEAVRERGKGSDDVIFFHISNIVELLVHRNVKDVRAAGSPGERKDRYPV
jgi:hypothetical protein